MLPLMAAAVLERLGPVGPANPTAFLSPSVACRTSGKSGNHYFFDNSVLKRPQSTMASNGWSSETGRRLSLRTLVM